MNQIIKSFLAIFMSMFLVVLTLGILSSFLNVLAAQNLHALFISELENSNFDKGVIEDCFARANDSGMDLEISLYGTDNLEVLIDNQSKIPDNTQYVSLAKVDLFYENRVDFFGIMDRHVLSGYAR